MKKAEVFVLIGALIFVGTVIGGILYVSRVNNHDVDRMAELERIAESRSEEIEMQTLKISELTKEITTQNAKLADMAIQLDRSRQGAAVLEGDLAKARSAIEAYLEHERRQLAGGTTTPNDVKFTDPRGAVTVEIIQIFTGEQIVSNSKLHEFQLADMRQQKKDAIYFDIKVTNNEFDGELSVSHYDFKLESVDGETFSPVQSLDYIHGEVHKGRSTRGGIVFAIYTNSVPKVLRFNTGLGVGGRIPLEAVSPDLRSYIPKK